MSAEKEFWLPWELMASCTGSNSGSGVGVLRSVGDPGKRRSVAVVS